MPGRARWRGGGRARQRPGVLAGERWPCHLRCDARACTRAHARALHERCMHSDTLHARTARTRRRALAASSALPCACTHACACASHDALHARPRSRTGRRQGRPCTRTSVWRAVRSIARDRIAPSLRGKLAEQPSRTQELAGGGSGEPHAARRALQTGAW
jgi:hypothetical protein